MIHDLDLRPILPPWVFEFLSLIIGLAVGSFANVCIYRIPDGQSVVRPPSRCRNKNSENEECGALVRPLDNVPVLSWLWLGGKCRSCRGPISVRYPLVEVANGLLYLGLALVGGPSIWTLVAMPLATALLVLALIDYDVQLLPNVITLPGIALGIAVSFLFGRGSPSAWPVGPWEAVLSASGGYLALLLVNLGYEKLQQAKEEFERPRFSGSPARFLAKFFTEPLRVLGKLVTEKFQGHPGLGQGDWKMAALLGAFLGWERMLLVVFLASLGGTAVAGWLVLRKEADGKTKLPLGTFLSAAGIFVLFGGDQVLTWYKGPFSRWIQGLFGG